MTKTTIQEVEVEYFDFPEAGIFITDQEAIHYLPCDKTDIEEWTLAHGDEDTDFTLEKEWVDNYPDRGYYESIKVLIEDAWDDQIRDYAFAHRSEWETREK
jgi:hypothetical protein